MCDSRALVIRLIDDVDLIVRMNTNVYIFCDLCLHDACDVT